MAEEVEYIRVTIPELVLNDLCSRFLINIPEEERNDVVRIIFQVELAHWFYIDFYRSQQPELPPCGLKEFTKIIFQSFPFLNKTGEDINKVFMDWKRYKMAVPVYGAIMMDERMQKVVLVQGYYSNASWGFPQGKVNKEESPVDCAIREVKEETSFDISAYVDEEEYQEISLQERQVRLYYVPGVPLDTVFYPQTRGEIKAIQWFNIKDLPAHRKDSRTKEKLGLSYNSFFMVMPFIKKLKQWMEDKHTKIVLEAMNSQPVPIPQPKVPVVPPEPSKPVTQVQKLLDKETARLKAEKKKAEAEKRRREQQEEFQMQHQINHPLRHHQRMQQQEIKASKGYITVQRSPQENDDSPAQAPIRILKRHVQSDSPVGQEGSPQSSKHSDRHFVPIQQPHEPSTSRERDSAPEVVPTQLEKLLLNAQVNEQKSLGRSITNQESLPETVKGQFSGATSREPLHYGGFSVSPASAFSKPLSSPQSHQQPLSKTKGESLSPRRHPQYHYRSFREIVSVTESAPFRFSAPAFENFKFDVKALMEA